MGAGPATVLAQLRAEKSRPVRIRREGSAGYLGADAPDWLLARARLNRAVTDC
jgi:hypothetical protein